MDRQCSEVRMHVALHASLGKVKVGDSRASSFCDSAEGAEGQASIEYQH